MIDKKTAAYFKALSSAPFSVALARIRRHVLKPQYPRYIVFAPTYRCNLKCTMCDVMRTSRFSKTNECSLAEFQRIFADPGLRKLDLIRITGGEPFLRKDLPELVLSILHLCRPRSIYITTNGTLPERIERLLQMFPFDEAELHLQVSIDALGIQQEEIRGVPGIFRTIEDSLALIEKYRQKKPFFSAINQVILHQNMDQLEPVQKLARKYGLGYKFMVGCRYNENTDIPINPIREAIPFLPAEGLTQLDLEKLYFHEYPRLRKQTGEWTFSKKQTTSFLWKLSEGYLFEGEINRLFFGKNKPMPPCMALFSYFRLLPDATIIPCNGLNQPAGNLKETTFSKLWFSDKLTEMRQKVVHCKGCWVECDIGPSIYYSGDIMPWLLSKIIKPYLWEKYDK